MNGHIEEQRYWCLGRRKPVVPTTPQCRDLTCGAHPKAESIEKSDSFFVEEPGSRKK